MKRKHTILSILKWTGLTLVLLIVAVLLLLAVNTDFSSPADTETFIRNKINKAGIPGISIAMISGDEVVKTIQVGYADIGNQIPVTEETIFQIASTSKTVTGTAIMQLYERGLLELDGTSTNTCPLRSAIPSTRTRPSPPATVDAHRGHERPLGGV
jgi:CubicO group peptidase (beta-lactamase class C family)